MSHRLYGRRCNPQIVYLYLISLSYITLCCNLKSKYLPTYELPMLGNIFKLVVRIRTVKISMPGGADTIKPAL